MNGENYIGRKVWFNNNGFVNTNNVYTIKEVVKHENDWPEYYLIENDKTGEKIEAIYYSIVFIYEDSLEKYLSDNECYVEEIYEYNGALIIEAEGDWKHTHLWLVSLMKYIHFSEMQSIVTEDNDSDYYSAKHFFQKAA